MAIYNFFMDYKHELLHVLAEAGEDGLSLMKIVKHVYNSNSNLFETPDFEKMYNDLAQYLSKQSKKSDGIVKRNGVRGVYVLNEGWSGYRQTMLDFSVTDFVDYQQNSESSCYVDQSLSLFDDIDL